MQDLGAKPVAIFDRLRLEHHDFAGSLSALKRMYRRLEAEHGPRAEAVAIPVENRFVNARRDIVARHLETLALLGEVTDLGGGKYVASASTV